MGCDGLHGGKYYVNLISASILVARDSFRVIYGTWLWWILSSVVVKWEPFDGRVGKSLLYIWLIYIYVFFIHQGYLDYGIFLNLQIYVDRWIVIREG